MVHGLRLIALTGDKKRAIRRWAPWHSVFWLCLIGLIYLLCRLRSDLQQNEFKRLCRAKALSFTKCWQGMSYICSLRFDNILHWLIDYIFNSWIVKTIAPGLWASNEIALPTLQRGTKPVSKNKFCPARHSRSGRWASWAPLLCELGTASTTGTFAGICVSGSTRWALNVHGRAAERRKLRAEEEHHCHELVFWPHGWVPPSSGWTNGLFKMAAVGPPP